MAISLPPIPREPIGETHSWREWLTRISQVFASGSNTFFSNLNFSGSNITSIVSRKHNDLQSIQGGALGDYQHLTTSQLANLYYKTWVSFTSKSTNQSITNSTTLTNDNDQFFTINSNEVWSGRTFLAIGGNINTTGIDVAIATPSGATGTVNVMLTTNATSSNESYLSVGNALNTSIPITATSIGGGATQAFLEIVWTITNGATAGTVHVQWCQNVSSATALTVYAGSQTKANREL